MSRTSHLVLTEFKVNAAKEWEVSPDVWLLLRLSSGFGYWRHPGTDFREMGPEDVLLVFPGASGTFLASRVGDVQMQAITIDLSLLGGVLTFPEGRALSAFASKNQQKVMFLPREHAFSTRFSEICRTQRANTLLPRLKLLQLFAELMDEGLQVPTPTEQDFSGSRMRLRQLIQAIPEAELMRCSVGELAERLRCSQRHFSRLFREEMGVSLREKQTALRLELARHLLEQSSSKVIDIALESGYECLSLFNVMFKARFGVTPTQWRARAQSAPPAKRRFGNGKAPTVALFAAITLGVVLCSRSLAAEAATTNAPVSRGAGGTSVPNAVPASTNAGPRFAVKGYRVSGNSLLSVDAMKQALRPHLGESVGLDTIKKAAADLVLAYRERGYVTVGVGLPQQQITNGIVNVQVSEGRLADIVILNNRYFSSNNVMRSLPGLSTGMVLNSKLFQAELDQANANRDRQIYPQIQPGPTPGTSTLLLKVKDRLPLHGRVELNNYDTPDTPDLRLVTALQYNNLWQIEHSVGLQYGFTPTDYKQPVLDDPMPFLDEPAIAFYNVYYRMPLLARPSVSARAAQQPAQFGYNEATRQFTVPPPSAVPELYLFFNRSTTDSELTASPRQLVVSNAVTSIYAWEDNRELTVTESTGFRINWPLLQGSPSAGLSGGFDLRYYETLGFHTNTFATTSIIPPADPNDPPETNTSLTISGRERTASVTYLPFVLRADGGIPDKSGVTSLFAGGTYSIPFGGLSEDEQLRAFTGADDSTAGFLAFNGSLVREQRIAGDWRMFFRAEGQIASEPVISNEQFALGGLSSVRGYAQGESFGDAGYRLSVEQRTPAFKLGKIGSAAIRARFLGFFDYGRTYLYEPLGRPSNTTLSGAGFGVNCTLGRVLDLGATVGWPLRSTSYTELGAPRFYFNVAAQF
jgi:hemolysin activation/secretion protein/AraC-like DNA-binding protein